MGLSMKKLEFVVMANSVDEVIDTLEPTNIKILKVVNTEAMKRKEAKASEKSSGCCGDKKKSPSLATRAINFAKSSTEHIVHGLKNVSDDEFLRRLNICKPCPSRLEGFERSECGCYMNIKAKWDLKNSCNLKKW